MRLNLKQIDEKWIFYSIVLLSIFLQFMLLAFTLEGLKKTLFAFKVSLADTSIIFLICLLFRGKWKYAMAVIPILLFVVLYVNVLYARYFSDLIPSSFYFNRYVFNPDTFAGAGSAFNWTDIFMFLIAVSPLIYSLLLPYKKFVSINPGKYLYIGAFVLLIAAWTLTLYRTYSNANKGERKISFSEVCRNMIHPINIYNKDWQYTYRRSNFTGYLIRCLFFSENGEYRNLSKKDWEGIKRHLETKREGRNIHNAEGDSIPENLILIVVESLPSAALKGEDIKYVAPTLFGLMQNKDNITVECESLVGCGTSSDAQFMYNTGLLPLRSEAIALAYPNNDYPSLSKALDRYSMEIIGESSVEWFHHVTTRSFGFDRLISDLDVAHPDADTRIFSEAVKQLDSVPRPFYMFITSISMHSPYYRKTVTPRLDERRLHTDDPLEIEYMQRLRELDDGIAKFLSALKKKGLYSNSLIMIIGDHPIPELEEIPKFRDTKVPLIILNSPRTQLKRNRFTQVDLFPTVLDIMNIDYVFKGIDYQGVGVSILAEEDRPLTDKDYEVSEQIIRSYLPAVK